MLSTSFVISANHPSLPGHFPMRPITPGVVALDHVVHGLLFHKPEATLAGFPQVKFLSPLMPEVEVTVIYKPKSATLYQFSCEVNNEIIILGQIKLTIKDG